MAGKKCTLKDIAAELKITVNSVSKALRNSSGISAKTTQAVKECAIRKGYIPNIAASSLRSGKSKNIAILYDYLTNPYYAVVTSHLDDNLSRHGYSVMIFTDRRSELTPEMAKRMIANNVCGVITFLQPGEEAKAIFEFNNVPLVVLGRDSSKLGIDSIVSDDEQGGYLATKHLIEKGHTQILAICLADGITCSLNRLEGYKRALAEYGIAYDEGLVKEFVRDGLSGAQIMEGAYLKGSTFTAVFCFNDIMAFEVVSYCQAKGIAVPQQLAVAGFDNLQKDICFPTRLTTVDTDKKQMVEAAVEVLLYKVGNKGAARPCVKKIHDTRLIQGITT